MSRIKSEQVLDTDRRIGQCLGAGMSVEKAAAHLGIAPNTVRNHLDGTNRLFIFNVKAEVEAMLASDTARTIVEVKAKASDRIEDLLGRGLTLTERAIAKAEKLGDDATLDELMDIHNKITVWASKFFVSEAPKQLKVGGVVEHEHHVMLDETVDSLKAFESHMRRALPPVIDVESEPAS